MKTGIVFEGGAVRTVYSCGVMDALIKQDIDFDYLVGVSAGIAYGVSFITKQFGRNLELLMKYAPDPRYMSFRNMLRPLQRKPVEGKDYLGSFAHFRWSEIHKGLCCLQLICL